MINAGTPVLLGGARLRTYRLIAGRAAYSCGVAVLLVLFAARVLQNAVAEGDTRTISLHHMHTDEDITITFKHDGHYDEAALEKLNRFLRDWRKNQEIRMDPHLIDLVWEVQREVGSKAPIWVVCGYRSPETNAMLRRRSGGVARFSQHMLGHALDFYIPGVNLEQLREVGLRLQRGGIGFYPSSGSPFVHMDTGGVRMWPRMSREQLMRVFPDGRTVHIPSDGRPLPGYALALANVRAHGGTPSELLLEQARDAGVNVADAGTTQHRVNPIAKLLGLAHDEEDEDGGAAKVASDAPAPPTEPLRTRAKAAVAAAVNHAEDKLANAKDKLARVEDKLAAERTKLVKVASKVHVISRAEAAPLAAQTPNQIILTRGYWQGSPDGAAAARPAQPSVNVLAAVSRPARVEVASADPEGTGSLAALATPRDDSSAPDGALAYAEQAGRVAAPPLGPTGFVASAALPRLSAPQFTESQTADNETTIAVKRIDGRAASVVFSVASNKLATPLADTTRLNDPWLRAIVFSPGVDRSLSITTVGAPNLRTLTALMVKPENSVTMTFASDPKADLASDHFGGSAVVFVSTVSYPVRTAILQ